VRLQGNYPYLEVRDLRSVPVNNPKYNVKQKDVLVKTVTYFVTRDATNQQLVLIKMNIIIY
jgi:hypothetical protein